MVTYKDAGVDIDAGNSLVDKIRQHCPSIGGFSGLYPFGDQFLAASTDGVGTKLKLAFAQNQHRTVGIDLVAMCANDIVAVGAKPLFFLDYYGTSKLNIEQAEEVILGILEGCRMAGCALLGGETAELPGMYQDGEYDLAGFVVGVVHRGDLVDGSRICSGDRILALPSSGVHSNGFSLVRKVMGGAGISLDSELAAQLLTPTRIYVDEALRLIRNHPIKGIAHITGGGIAENTARILPEGLAPDIDYTCWKPAEIFHWIQETGNVPDEEMRRTFNLGAGMSFVVDASTAEEILAEQGEMFPIGWVKEV